MSDLLQIVSGKLQASTGRIAERLKAQIQAQKNENTAKGLLRSGATLKQILRHSSEALDKTREAIAAEYQQLLKDSLAFSAASTPALIREAQKHLHEIRAQGEAELRAATAMMGKDDLYERLQKDLGAAYDRALTDLSLFLDYEGSAQKNRFIKRASAAVGGWLSGFLPKGPQQ